MDFLNGLPDAFKQEFQKKYRTSELASLHDVYEHARTFEMSMQWNPKHSRRASDQPKSGSNDGSSSGKHNRQEKYSRNEKTKQKDRDVRLGTS